jgi:predicted acylesterase/phospholipase RssA
MPRYCDIVMKGGITSGVVYPLAAVKLAERYRFRNVGGTSAGAIAAAAVAAAERGRSRGRDDGFAELRDLPRWLSANLVSLFQPQPATAPLFRLALAAVAPRGRAPRVAAAALGGFPLAALLGVLPGALLAAALIASTGGLALAWGLICALILAVAGITAAVAVAIARRGARALPENGFGLVGGGSVQRSDSPALTEWLADLLDRLSGTDRGRALTFGDLWGQRDPDAEREINLEMMTTCLTQGRPYRLPFATADFWFLPDQMRRLFPDRVVDQMVRDAPADERAERFAPLVPMPKAPDLPVVVATRMSLSFPLLISAVPLYAIDYSQALADEDRHPEPCWFSDGGIVSNFPIHFFDSPVPRWPTFAIDLRKVPDGWALSDDERRNVWMAADNDTKGDDWWTRWEQRHPAGKLAGFVGSIVRTMQNWNDTMQSHVQGYRDRVVHIDHSASEGGVNLEMPKETIEKLTLRGEFAGDLLARRFAVPPETRSPLTWDNQRWIRYRAFMALLEDALVRLRRGCLEPEPGDRPIEELGRRRQDEPPEYRWESEPQREFALAATAELLAQAERWQASDEGFARGAPQPAPVLRTSPHV